MRRASLAQVEMMLAQNDDDGFEQRLDRALR
jgi:hypothetical protein